MTGSSYETDKHTINLETKSSCCVKINESSLSLKSLLNNDEVLDSDLSRRECYQWYIVPRCSYKEHGVRFRLLVGTRLRVELLRRPRSKVSRYLHVS